MSNLSRSDKVALYGAVIVAVLSAVTSVYNTNMLSEISKNEMQDKRIHYDYEISKTSKKEAINQSLDLMNKSVADYCLNQNTSIDMVLVRSISNNLYFTDDTGLLYKNFNFFIKSILEKKTFEEDLNINKQNILSSYRDFRIEARKQLGGDKNTWVDREDGQSISYANHNNKNEMLNETYLSSGSAENNQVNNAQDSNLVYKENSKIMCLEDVE